jgi:hypothetical protein
MLRKIITLLSAMIISLITFSQSRLGDVACVYVTTANLDSSIALYEKMGFPKVNSNTIPVPWAQVSDGSLLIMMRQDNSPYIGLTYYANDVDEKASQLENAGIVFARKPKEGDPIKRYYIKTPDGFTIIMSNNLGGFKQPIGRTMLDMKPAEFQSADKYPNKLCGAFGEFCHPVKDLDASIAFWKQLGFEVKTKMTEPYPWAIVTDGLMLIGLHQTKDFDYPAITYFGINTDKRAEDLKAKGVPMTPFMSKTNMVINTWEGQHFFLFSMGM